MSRRWCQWAACRNPASAVVEGHLMCSIHTREHVRLRAEEQRQVEQPVKFVPRANRKPAECGTRSGYQRHKRLSEPPCDRCTAMEQEYQRIRQQRRTTSTGRAATGKTQPGRDNHQTPGDAA